MMGKKKLIATCPTCGKGSLSSKIVTWTFKVEGKSVDVPGVHVQVCDACHDELADAKEVRRAETIAGKIPAGKRAVGQG